MKQPSASVMYGARPGLSSAWMEAPKPPPRATAATTTKLILLTRFPYLLFGCSIPFFWLQHSNAYFTGRTDQWGRAVCNGFLVQSLARPPGAR